MLWIVLILRGGPLTSRLNGILLALNRPTEGCTCASMTPNSALEVSLLAAEATLLRSSFPTDISDETCIQTLCNDR
jgi:hypothetical protein